MRYKNCNAQWSGVGDCAVLIECCSWIESSSKSKRAELCAACCSRAQSWSHCDSISDQMVEECHVHQLPSRGPREESSLATGRIGIISLRWLLRWRGKSVDFNVYSKPIVKQELFSSLPHFSQSVWAFTQVLVYQWMTGWWPSNGGWIRPLSASLTRRDWTGLHPAQISCVRYYN